MGEALRRFLLALTMTSEQMLIAGEWCDADDSATAVVLNPATGEVIAKLLKLQLEMSRSVFLLLERHYNRKIGRQWTLHKEVEFYKKWLQQLMQMQRV